MVAGRGTRCPYRREPVYGVALVRSRSVPRVESSRLKMGARVEPPSSKNDGVIGQLATQLGTTTPTPAAGRRVHAVIEDLAGSARVLGGSERPAHFIAMNEGFEDPFAQWVGRAEILARSAGCSGPVVARM